MLKPAFSTVACPDWTLERVARAAREYGFPAVELRTFGHDSRELACDPALTSAAKVRRMFDEAGVQIVSLGTSLRFDEPINPPVIGFAISDTERSVRAGKLAIELAASVGAPYIRVFGFEGPARERLSSLLSRVAGRLSMVADHAHRTGVQIVFENGGAFPRASDIATVIREVNSQLVGAAYSIAAGAAAGDTPQGAIETLGDRLWVARVKDHRAGEACPLGEGEVACREFVHGLVRAGFEGPLVYEWDRMWLRDLAPAETVLPAASETLFRWMAEASAGAGQRGHAVA